LTIPDLKEILKNKKLQVARIFGQDPPFPHSFQRTWSRSWISRRMFRGTWGIIGGTSDN
jgi:hypothetical protein